MEVEAVDEGTLAKIVVPEGTDDVPVNQVIAVLAGEGEDVKAAAASRRVSPPRRRSPRGACGTAATPAPAAPQAGLLPPLHSSREPPQPRRPPSDGGNRIFSSPLARRLAKEAGIDISRIARLRPAWPRDRTRRRCGEIRQGLAPRRAPATLQQPLHRAIAPAMADEQIRALYADGSYEVVPHDDMRKDHRAAADRVEADHPAFLSHRRLQHRQAPGRARGDQRAGAEGQGRQARLQALGQRFRHQGAGAGAAARAGCQRDLDRRRHAEAQAFRRRRRGRHAGRADHADHSHGRNQIAVDDFQ